MAGTDVEQAEDSPDSPDGKDDKPYDIYLGTMRGAFVSFGTGTKSTTKLVLGVQRQYRDVALKLQDEEGYIIEAHFYRRARRADRAAVRAGVGIQADDEAVQAGVVVVPDENNWWNLDDGESIVDPDHPSMTGEWIEVAASEADAVVLDASNLLIAGVNGGSSNGARPVAARERHGAENAPTPGPAQKIRFQPPRFTPPSTK